MKKLKNAKLRLCSIILTITVLFSIITVAPFTVSAADGDYFRYSYDEDGFAYVLDYFGNSKSITIPAKTPDGDDILGIMPEAFVGNKKLESVKISQGVVGIGSSAFRDCTNLKSISLPDSILIMSDDVFTNTKYYNTKSNWQSGALYAGKCLLELKTTAEKYTVKPGTMTIAIFACVGNKKLKTLTFPDSVFSFNALSVYDCPALKSVNIPYDAGYIGDGAFGFKGKKDLSNASVVSGFTIYGYKGTIAEEYAKAYGFKFVNTTTAKTLTLNKSSITMGVGESYRLIKAVTPASAAKVTWKSSNTSIVSVSDGVIKAKKTGTATITVKTASGLSKSCKVTVKKAPASATLNTTSLALGNGETYTLSAKLNSGTYSYNVGWSSSNTKVVAVEKQGYKCKLTAKGEGTATVTFKTFNGKKVSCNVTVKKAPTSAKLGTNALTMGKGESAIITRGVNSGAYTKAVILSTSNPKVATAQNLSNGRIQINAKGTGTATITYKTYNGKKATCKVTVKKTPTSATLNTTSLALGNGETYTLSAKLNSGAYSYNLSWTSSNTKVVAVEKQGYKCKLTAKGEGTATVTFKTFNGKKVSCNVTVKKAPTSAKLGTSTLTMKKGESAIVTRGVNSGAYTKAVILSTSNPKVATAQNQSYGRIKINAVGPGTATITYKTYNGKTASCEVTVN